MNYLKLCLFSLTALLSINSFAYENVCSSVFNNGIQAHDKAIIEFKHGAKASNVSKHELYAKKLKLPRRGAASTCDGKVCTKNNTGSTLFPEYEFNNVEKSEKKKLNKGWWFSSINISDSTYKTISVKPFSTATFKHQGSEFTAKRVTLRAGSTLVLKPGDYWIEKFYLSAGATIEQSSPGQIRIFAKSISTAFGNTLGANDNAHSLLIVSDKLKIGSFNSVNAFLYVHQNAKIGSFSSVLGAVSAEKLNLETYSNVTYLSDGVGKINYAWLCDYDSDGIYDGFDDDSDNDGYSDEIELLAGSDIYDDSDVPSDMDGDGIPDVIDNDIDGDGYTNEEEAELGTDPTDPNSFPSNPPSIELAIESGQFVERDNIYIAGSIVFGSRPIAKLYVYKAQSPSEIQLINYNNDGGYTAELSLEEGLNEFVVVVEDMDGAQDQVAFNVTYVVPFKILSVSPSTSSTLNESTVELTIEVKADAQPELRVNEQLASFISVTNSIYTFRKSYELSPGNNVIQVRALNGKKTLGETVEYRFEPTDMTQYPAPKISISTPAENSLFDREKVSFSASIESNVGGLSASIDGLPVKLTKANNNQYSIRHSLDLNEGENTFVIEVKDALEQTSSQPLTVMRDTTAPEINIIGDYLLPPTPNFLPNAKFALSGEVFGSDVASVKIAGQQVQLTEKESSVYHFTHNLNIASNQDVLVDVTATDELGNSRTLAYYFHATSNLSMSWVTPVFPVTWILENLTAKPFALKLHDTTGNEEFTISLESEATAPKTIDFNRVGDLLTGALPPITEKGSYTLTVKALESGKEITQLSNELKVISQQDIPIKVTKVIPEPEQNNIEPNTFLQVNFNRPIDIDKLSIVARRTLHGKTYVNLDASGTNFLHAKGMQLVQVDVDRELVNGSISVLPDDSSFVFYPENDLGYTADIDWQILYDGELLAKQRFETRSLPTTIDGGVKDSFGQTIEGVSVEIEELGRTTTTNNDGGFSFGYGASADNNILQGRYHLLVNKGSKYPRLGEIRIPFDIKQGKRNQLPILRVPNINDDIQRISVTPGSNTVRLANGELELDLTNARLEFPTNSTAIHAQFIPASNNVRRVYQGAAALWFYQLQPFGIKPTNPIDVKIKVPLLNGSDRYLMIKEGEVGYSFILGYNQTKDVIEPVGVVKIEDGYMHSINPISFDTLDYLGYTHTHPKYQDLFKQYELGQVSFIELVAEVTAEQL
ncbi:hypothetical protein [Bermanella sp. R86510]|uniref:hypothetical protein n=1 Tax=unclassified Bermanella TaxID=2627862 RepID=UPI0037C91C5F